MHHKIVILVAILLATSSVAAQERVSFAFWNTENLFDTIPSRFYDDSDYTPAGRYRWNTEKYNRKLVNIAHVISDMGVDVITLAEIENEDVVRDLVLALDDDYCYVHQTSSDGRGIDIAMLYKGDKFFPDKTELIRSGSSRELLHVSGTLCDEQIHILVCHLPSKSNKTTYRRRAMERLKVVADSLTNIAPNTKTIVMGDFNCDPAEKPFRTVFGEVANHSLRDGFYDKSGYYAAIKSTRNGGIGSYIYADRHFLLDNILLSPQFIYGSQGLVFQSGGVFVREYMLTSSSDDNIRRHKYPLRTFSGGNYLAGYSDHLPVYVILK